MKVQLEVDPHTENTCEEIIKQYKSSDILVTVVRVVKQLWESLPRVQVQGSNIKVPRQGERVPRQGERSTSGREIHVREREFHVREREVHVREGEESKSGEPKNAQYSTAVSNAIQLEKCHKLCFNFSILNREH